MQAIKKSNRESFEFESNLITRLKMFCSIISEELDQIKTGKLPTPSFWHAREMLLVLAEDVKAISNLKEKLIILAYQLIHLRWFQPEAFQKAKREIVEILGVDDRC